MKIQITILALTLAAGLASQAAIQRGPAAAPTEFDALIKESKKSELELKAKLDQQMGRTDEVKKPVYHQAGKMTSDQVVASTENFFSQKAKRKFIRNRNQDMNRISQEMQGLGN